MLCGAAFAQTVSVGEGDTVHIRVTLRMVGAAWSIDTLADGWDNDSYVLDSVWSYDGDSFWVNAGEVDPCSVLVPAYWLENLGGITLDILVRAETGPDWVWHDSLLDCASIEALGMPDVAGIAIVAMRADGIIDDFSPALISSRCIPPVTGSWDEIDIDSYYPSPPYFSWRYPYVDSTGTNLAAHDPLVAPGDGEYRRDNDQMELYFYILPPPISTATEAQKVRFWIKAKISD